MLIFPGYSRHWVSAWLHRNEKEILQLGHSQSVWEVIKENQYVQYHMLSAIVYEGIKYDGSRSKTRYKHCAYKKYPGSSGKDYKC